MHLRISEREFESIDGGSNPTPHPGYTELQAALVHAFESRRGLSLGGPIQIRSKSGKRFDHVVSGGRMSSESAQIEHNTPTMVASMSKVVTGLACVISMELFQHFGAKVGDLPFTPELPLHAIGVLEGAQYPEEFSRLDPKLGLLSVKRTWSALATGSKAAAVAKTILFRHLLTHTAGLASGLYLGQGGYINDFSWLSNAPGDQFDYGTGYDVAGRALAAIWRKFGGSFSFPNAAKAPAAWESIGDVADALVFRPLGMVHSQFVSMHDFAVMSEWTVLEYVTRQGTVTTRDIYGGRDLMTTGDDFSRFLLALLHRGEVTASMQEQGAPGLHVQYEHPDHAATSAWDSSRLLPEDKFTDYVLRNHLPAEWDSVDDDSVNELCGGNGRQGLDHHMGHSLVAAVSVVGPGTSGPPADMFDLHRPRHGEAGTHLYWRGMMGSVWHVDFSREMTFVHVTRNSERLGRILPREVEGYYRRTFTVKHDRLCGPLFPVMDELAGDLEAIYEALEGWKEQGRQKEDLTLRIGTLEMEINALVQAVDALKAKFGEMQVQLKRPGEDDPA